MDEKTDGTSLIAEKPEVEEAVIQEQAIENSDSKQVLNVEAPKWKAQLPDDLKNNADLDKYANIGDLAKAVLGGSKEMSIPGDDDTEAWGKLYGQMGRPEKSEEYKLDESINETVSTQMRTLAHDMGLNQKQLDKLSGVIKNSNEHQALVDEATYKGTAKETETALKAEFGDKTEAKLEYMKRGAEKLLPPVLRKVLGSYNQLNNPDLVKACIAYGEATADDLASPASNSGKDDGGWKYPD